MKIINLYTRILYFIIVSLPLALLMLISINIIYTIKEIYDIRNK